MSTTIKASVHLGSGDTEKLEVYRNTHFEGLQNLFDVTQRLILEHHVEILKVSPVDWTAPSWTRSALTRDQVITWTKVHVYSDSVLCLGLGSMQGDSEATRTCFIGNPPEDPERPHKKRSER